MLGAVLGSFAATLVVRWPAGRSLGGRSQCDGCGVGVPAWRLVPIVSYLAQRGRASCCGARISALHPGVELCCALTGVAAFAVLGPELALVGTLFGAALVTLAALDLAHLWLPDRIVAPLAVAGLGVALLAPPSLPERLIGMAAGYGSLAAIALAYRGLRGREGMGGGDPKLFAAIGAWTGWLGLPFVLLGASVLGLAYALVAVAGGARMERTTALPFGAFLAIAAFPAWLALSVR